MLSNPFTTIHVYVSDTYKKTFIKLKSNDSPRCDKIYPNLIKNIACHIVKPLRMIFSNSFTTGGIVCPIYMNNGIPNNPAFCTWRVWTTSYLLNAHNF